METPQYKLAEHLKPGDRIYFFDNKESTVVESYPILYCCKKGDKIHIEMPTMMMFPKAVVSFSLGKSRKGEYFTTYEEAREYHIYLRKEAINIAQEALNIAKNTPIEEPSSVKEMKFHPLSEGVKIPKGYRQLAIGEYTISGDQVYAPLYPDKPKENLDWYTSNYGIRIVDVTPHIFCREANKTTQIFEV